MSSCLNFYLVPKDDENKRLNIYSFSRSHPIYQAFNDNMSLPFMGDDLKPIYEELSINDVNNILNDLQNRINSSNNRLQEYERYASKNIEYIEEIISQKEYIEELKCTIAYVQMIKYLFDDMQYNSSPFSKILINEG